MAVLVAVSHVSATLFRPFPVKTLSLFKLAQLSHSAPRNRYGRAQREKQRQTRGQVEGPLLRSGIAVYSVPIRDHVNHLGIRANNLLISPVLTPLSARRVVDVWPRSKAPRRSCYRFLG